MELMDIFPLIFLHILGSLATTNDIIIVTDLIDGTILTGSIDTLELVQIPLENIGKPVAVDFDPVEQKVYWTDDQHKTISRAFLNGTGQELVMSMAVLTVPEGIAIDVENRHLYWTDAGLRKIERANLDGSGRKIIVEENIDQPRAIAVHSTERHLYWADWGADAKIERANVNGSERITLVDTEIQNPNGITIDYTGRRLYWCDAGLNRIEWIYLDGSNRTALLHSLTQDIHPFDIAIFKDAIYWSDWTLSKLVKMDRHAIGQASKVVGPAVFRQAGGLHIQQDTNECEQITNVCHINANCINTPGSYYCQCKAGYIRDGKASCTDIDECGSSPCQNGGTCTNLENNFQCNCSAGYSGITCDTDINECEPNPCKNDGVCINQVNTFDCACLNGFKGDLCEIFFVTDKNDCNPNPCDNGGTCLDKTNDFNCACVNGFTGDRCEIKVADINEPRSCDHPGNVENGHVIADKTDDVYEPGVKMMYVCEENYILEGPKEIFCQSDATWSHESPVCLKENEERSNDLYVIAGAGGGVLILVIVVIVIVIVASCKMGREKPRECILGGAQDGNTVGQNRGTVMIPEPNPPLAPPPYDHAARANGGCLQEEDCVKVKIHEPRNNDH